MDIYIVFLKKGRQMELWCDILRIKPKAATDVVNIVIRLCADLSG